MRTRRDPQRNRRHGLTTRIAEGTTRWRGGLAGGGVAETLDHIVDGKADGIARGG